MEKKVKLEQFKTLQKKNYRKFQGGIRDFKLNTRPYFPKENN